MSAQAQKLAIHIARSAVLVLVLAGVGLIGASDRSLNGDAARAADGNIDGSTSQCDSFRLYFDLLLIDFDFEIAEEGWVYANGVGTADKFREASGVVTKSKVAHNDTPANHYSHDWNVDIRVDPGQEGLVSDVNGPNATGKNIEMEWETGVLPDETSGDGANPSIPRWVLPNLGDRAWSEGHWVFDCGHSRDVGGVPHFPTEIHPARALASMRPQADVLPGSGTTRVPVTSTDLYIHGSGTFMVQQLECGIYIIIDNVSCPTKTTPIDELYSFEVCLPPKPVPWATVDWSIAPGPDDNGFATNPEVTTMTAGGGCLLPPDEFGNEFDAGTMLNVEVDLRGSGIAPTDIYSRKIVAGWVYPPATPLPHLNLELSLLDLHQDHEFDPFDGEMTFWWMALNRAPTDEWHRLVNWEIPTYDDAGYACFGHTNYLQDVDDDGYCGNGEVQFSGPLWDFYLRHGQSLSLQTTGFEQDCYDDHFGSGDFNIGYLVDCHFGNVLLESANDWGNNDALAVMDAFIVEPGGNPLDVLGYHNPGVSDFDFDVTLSEVPLVDEDTAALSLTKNCTHAGEVALAGEPFTCTVVVSNAGPGLPRDVVVTDVLTSTVDPSQYSVGQAAFRVGAGSQAFPCGASGDGGFECAIGTVPVGGTVTIEVQITPLKPGQFSNTASVSTDSTEADATDNSYGAEVDVYLPVVIDISPGSASNPLNLAKKGVMTVAIITTPEFDAATLQVVTACFGDSGDAAQRNCEEMHGKAHLADADKDKDVDLLFHFSVLETGIDLGDTTACLRGTTADGNGFYGCDVVSPM